MHGGATRRLRRGGGSGHGYTDGGGGASGGASRGCCSSRGAVWFALLALPTALVLLTPGPGGFYGGGEPDPEDADPPPSAVHSGAVSRLAQLTPVRVPSQCRCPQNRPLAPVHHPFLQFMRQPLRPALEHTPACSDEATSTLRRGQSPRKVAQARVRGKDAGVPQGPTAPPCPVGARTR